MEQSNASLKRGCQPRVRKRMATPHRQSVARISVEHGMHAVMLYNLARLGTLWKGLTSPWQRGPGGGRNWSNSYSDASYNQSKIEADNSRSHSPGCILNGRGTHLPQESKPFTCHCLSSNKSSESSGFTPYKGVRPRGIIKCKHRQKHDLHEFNLS